MSTKNKVAVTVVFFLGTLLVHEAVKRRLDQAYKRQRHHGFDCTNSHHLPRTEE